MRLLLIDGLHRPIYYRELQEALAAEYLTSAPDSVVDIPDGVDLALVSDEFDSRAALLVRACRRRGVPTLHVPDGVVEWRNTWENPRSASQEAGMPLFQPVLCDKIACLGRGHARVLESLGNRGKCEIVGMPRLDHAVDRRGTGTASSGVLRLLIATARTPHFSRDHEQSVLSALRDLRRRLRPGSKIAGRPVEVIWRLTGDVPRALDLGERSGALDRPLREVLAQVDAVVSTPSTVILEAMLHGLPVAGLDYGNRPQYFNTAWSIAAPDHIEGVLSELARPSPARLLYQEMQLHDALECRTPATPRLVRLVVEMVRLSKPAADGRPPSLPSRILPEEATAADPEWEPARLHPQHPVFGRSELAELQAELGQLYIQLAQRVPPGRALELETKLRRYEQYGCGPLLARLVTAFPFPRRTIRAVRYWLEDRRAAGKQRS
jgi:hypothetical protein